MYIHRYIYVYFPPVSDLNTNEDVYFINLGDRDKRNKRVEVKR
jgi:hypothetical protein